MSGPPAQGYKMSGEGYAGGGPDGSAVGNTSAAVAGGGSSSSAQNMASSGPPQEIAGTLPNDFNLANTKAEAKGEDHQPIYSHDEDIPANEPSQQAQRNEGSRPINGPA